MEYAELDYDSYKDIMSKELSLMCKLLDDLDKTIKERKKENKNGSGSNCDTSS